MNNDIKIKTTELVDETIKNIQTMVKIPSVRNVEGKVEGAPFGPAIREALEKFLELASEIGLRTYCDPEGYYGYAEIGPETGEMIGILGHIDVVPQGDESKWTEAAPFSAEIVDEKIIGRGSLDDKGPMVISLMGVKALLDLGFTFEKRVRFIVGTAEETTWEGINAYRAKEEMPDTGFSPDANFPVINAEKTIVQYDAIGNVDVDFTVVSAGAYNAVADSAIYTGTKADAIAKELQTFGYEFDQRSATEIEVHGVAAHAMACHLGKNAITRLAEAMHAAGETTPGIEFLATQVKDTKNGELICGHVEEEVSGLLTLNVGNINIKDGQEIIGLDSRIPVLADHEEIIAKYEAAVKAAGLDFRIHKVDEKLYVDEADELIQTLMSVYKEVTGDMNARPLSSGGGTYARAMKKGVAFGMVFADQGMIDKMHQANECLELKFIQPTLEIYTNVIAKLAQK